MSPGRPTRRPSRQQSLLRLPAKPGAAEAFYPGFGRGESKVS